MKKVIILILSCFMMNWAFSQKLIIEDTLNLKRGIYKTFDEFKYNSPSIKLNYEVLRVDDLTCQLKIEKDSTEYYGSVWGFCDGKNVYINWTIDMSGRKVFRPNSLFCIIQHLGRYCYFLTSPVTITNIYAGASYFPYALDINNGKELCLNCDPNFWFIKKSHMKKILSKDPELWNSFNKDRSKEDRFKKYIKLYSARYAEEAIQ